MKQRRAWFLVGLFFTTLATLSLEILNTRLLSVITWYHLSFFAVSTALFGMSAGALRVSLGSPRFQDQNAAAELARHGTFLALSIPICHILNLLIPIRTEISALAVAGLTYTTVAVAVPFYFSGVVVAIALTRIPGPSGLIYAVDLIGASLGCLLIVPLLQGSNISSAVLVCGGGAAAGAVCFHRFARTNRAPRNAALCLVLLAAAALNAGAERGLKVASAKGMVFPAELAGAIVGEYWTIHGFVSVRAPTDGPAFYWGAGEGSQRFRVNKMSMMIDGFAGTGITRWSGARRELRWVKYDVTSLPYHLRKKGKVAVIGVGGGRDILTALWSKARSVTGIEINRAFVHYLTGPYRGYARIADHPAVTLVHDEARSYLTQSQKRFDVIQMSLIDTWAATGAGAFTLSENGLYTTDAWKVFLGRLEPRGLFSVSRWYSPASVSETSRLVSLATASLLRIGVAEPVRHMALIARHSCATLILSPSPFRQKDIDKLGRISRRMGFTVLLLPGVERQDRFLSEIARSASLAELEGAVQDDLYDYSPPDDRRPYFFNILRPKGLLHRSESEAGFGAVAAGNLLATRVLLILWAISMLLVVAVILVPLVRDGLPSLDRTSFVESIFYFTLIGLGFMWVQIPLMQRFSVYLGHPVYAVVVILFCMILSAGLGSWISDRVDLAKGAGPLVAGPLFITFLLLAVTFSLQAVFDATIAGDLPARCLIAVAMVAPPSFFMGFCFPFGLRLVSRLADDALPWMWGVNGACSVFSSVTAVAISMWSGIHTNLFLAAGAYALLMFPAFNLWKRGTASLLHFVRPTPVPIPGATTTKGDDDIGVSPGLAVFRGVSFRERGCGGPGRDGP